MVGKFGTLTMTMIVSLYFVIVFVSTSTAIPLTVESGSTVSHVNEVRPSHRLDSSFSEATGSLHPSRSIDVTPVVTDISKRAIVTTVTHMVTPTILTSKNTIEPTSVIHSSSSVPISSSKNNSKDDLLSVTTITTTTTTTTTELPEYEDTDMTKIENDFLVSLKDAVRKVVNFTVGYMLSPFLIGAHRIAMAPVTNATTSNITTTTTTPNSVEANTVDID